MKPKDLLFQLSYLESHLNNFAYEKLTVDEADHIIKSFRFFKRNLLEKISPSGLGGHKDASKNLKRTVFDFEKSVIGEDSFIMDLDLSTYDAIIKHYNAYGAVLKSLKIESSMKKENHSTLIFNESAMPIIYSSKTIDLNIVLEECMGEMDLLVELIRLYERNALEFIGAAKIHLQTADFKQLELAAHKIKAGLAMMKTKGLHSIVLQIEQACREDRDQKHLQFLYNCFTAEFPLVLKALNEGLTHLRENKE